MTAPRRPTPTLLNELQDCLILPGMLGFTKLGYAWRKRSWAPLTVSMRGRTVVVTGATSGLGEAAARQIAALGARVVIVGRSREKAEASRKAIVAASGNDDVGVALADLSLLRDVRKLAHCLLMSEPRIHVLVNNAGVLLNERTTTAEGNETSLATNLLAPYGVVVIAMHPGWADTPGVATSLPAFRSMTEPLLRDADEGADTIPGSRRHPRRAMKGLPMFIRKLTLLLGAALVLAFVSATPRATGRRA